MNYFKKKKYLTWVERLKTKKETINTKEKHFELAKENLKQKTKN